MKNFNEYILEKLKINKDTKLDSDIRLLFLHIYLDRKTNQMVPDLVKVINENEESITFQYLTDNYNQRGNIKTLQLASFKTDVKDAVISDYLKTKWYAILKKNRAIEILEYLIEQYTNQSNFKYSWYDLIYEDPGSHNIKRDLSYVSISHDKIHSTPSPTYTQIITVDELKELLKKIS